MKSNLNLNRPHRIQSLQSRPRQPRAKVQPAPPQKAWNVSQGFVWNSPLILQMKTTEVSLKEFWMPESHRPHDVTKVVSREELLLLGVKQVEADLEISGVKNRNRTCWLHLQTLDFIVGQIGLLIDLLKVNISVGVSFAWIGLDNFCNFQSVVHQPWLGMRSQRSSRRHWVVKGIPVPLSLSPSLTIWQFLSLTVFSPHHACHANHIASLNVQRSNNVQRCTLLYRHMLIVFVVSWIIGWSPESYYFYEGQHIQTEF